MHSFNRIKENPLLQQSGSSTARCQGDTDITILFIYVDLFFFVYTCARTMYIGTFFLNLLAVMYMFID